MTFFSNISVNFFPWFLECIVVASENPVSILLRHFNRISNISVTGSGEIFTFNRLLPLAESQNIPLKINSHRIETLF